MSVQKDCISEINKTQTVNHVRWSCSDRWVDFLFSFKFKFYQANLNLYGAFFVTLTLTPTKYALPYHTCLLFRFDFRFPINTIQVYVYTQPIPSLQSPFHNCNPSIMID